MLYEICSQHLAMQGTERTINTERETLRNETSQRIIPFPSSIAAKDRCRNSPPINRPMASGYYPTCRGISERISRFFRQQQIKVVLKPLTTVNSLFPRRKAQEMVDRPESGIVYKISCTNCSFVYYDQTERSLKLGLKNAKGLFPCSSMTPRFPAVSTNTTT